MATRRGAITDGWKSSSLHIWSGSDRWKDSLVGKDVCDEDSKIMEIGKHKKVGKNQVPWTSGEAVVNTE